MAELAGTIVGVVSLGLQVCSGINAYLDGIQSRKEDIASTTRHCKTTEILLKETESLRGRLAGLASTNSTALQEHITAAKAELLLLENYLAKICTESSSKKILYPFRRDHLNLLDSRLERASKALQGALQLAGLEVSLNSSESLRGMRTSFETLAQDFSETSSEMQTSIIEIRESTSLSRQENMAIMESVAQLNTMMSALVSSGPVALVPRLVSKPDTLRRVCDEMEVRQTLRPGHQASSPRPDSSLVMKSSEQPINTYPELHCRCNCRRISHRRKREFGPAFVLSKNVIERVHLAGCPLAGFDVEMTRSWSAGISIRAFRKLVSTAVTLTMFSTLGAGGFGLAPSISYHNIRDQSPAFKVIDLLIKAFEARVWNEYESTELVQRGIRSLQASFMAKTSSPSDLDSKGETLLSHLAFFSYSPSFVRHRNVILDFLAKARVSRDRPDQFGILPLQRVLSAFIVQSKHSTQSLQTIDNLCPDELVFDFDIGEMNEIGFILNRMSLYRTVIKNSSRIKKLYEDHPLESIFREDKKALLEMLNRDSSTPDLSSVGAFKETALHHLVGWTEGLRIILRRFGKSIIQKHDLRTTTVLRSALFWSGQICASPKTVRCSKTCCCADSVKVLLEVDSDCVSRTVTRSGHGWTTALAEASWRARDLAIEELKHRRQQLKELALSRLKPVDIDRLALCEPQVLDQHTGEVLKALQAAGENLPAQLTTNTVDRWSRTNSMYHQIGHTHINSVLLAGALYSKGFHDVDLLDDRGLTPLCISKCSRFSAWLIDHGANLGKEIPGNVGSTAAHYLFSQLGNYLIYKMEGISNILETVRILPHYDSYLDECRCGCSSDGCHPYTVMWNVVMCPWPTYCTTRTSLTEIMKRIYRQCVILEDGWEVPRRIKSICLRACTFGALPLRHTCCSCWAYDEYNNWVRTETFSKLEESEIQEIREEEVVELALLEALILEFERKLDEVNCSLAEFFQTHWVTRMDEVIGEMEDRALREEDIKGARELGIVLQVKDTEEREEIEGDKSQLAYWYKRLDALIE
ncbi:hypothetical protein CT0861_00106 [Colletotrichum tofieldiae]|uniref:Fungal N-terminal domain-containing protein n=1 Tax=Colletotrichum tofieldiae TaxID=708197 RepID=A0A166VIK5_9PEZI|nr:hypothetical protein CT0861_00106 [Colletotrichum tofieldiae]